MPFARIRFPKLQIKYNSVMPHYLDVASWARRDTFEFFRHFDKPYFNVCTTLDVTNLLEFLKSRSGYSVSLAYHYFAVRAANEIEPFRYRLKDGRVIVYDVIHGGTTVLLPNEAFILAYFDFDPDFDKFMPAAQRNVEEAIASSTFSPRPNDDAIHFTTVPWIAFTSFAHARTPGRGDSVPRFVFGKFTEEPGHVWMPISIEVHHALVDGLHVGRYLAKLEEALSDPAEFIARPGSGWGSG